MQPQPTDDITDLLVAYALDALEPEEMARVSALLAERPDLQALLDELRATAGLLPYGLPAAAPPSELRQRVLDHATGAALRQPREPARGAIGGRLRVWLYALGGLAGAALLALAITLGQLGGARGEIAQIRQQLDQAELQIDALTREREQIAQAVAGATELARLDGPGGGASVLRAADGELLLAAQLPPLASDQVYQLWLIAGQEAPVSGGVFTVGGDGVGVLALGPGAAAAGLTLAVTAEPGPDGSPGPTTDVLIIGQLS